MNRTAKLIQSTLLFLSYVFPTLTALTTPFTWDAFLPISTVISCPSFKAQLSYQLHEVTSKTPAGCDPSFLWTLTASPFISDTIPYPLCSRVFCAEVVSSYACMSAQSQQSVNVCWMNWEAALSKCYIVWPGNAEFLQVILFIQVGHDIPI